MRVTLVLCFLTAFVLPGLAQHASIKGSVSDTAENLPLVNSVVMILQQKDSFLVAFVRADRNGSFSFNHLPAGKMILKVSYPAFADHLTDLTLGDSSDLDLHAIPMIEKSKLLQEVVVHGNMAAIRMKGDTLEFKADSFKVNQGASVEELLRKLPGIQVDNAGQITAQGKSVKKVLVDGEEFFGDDPTLVTQNLKADMVDRVQVYDKKSDQAAFTGIEDGEKSKTINLQLKENKKKGYFGKLEAGAGTNKYFNNQAMFNLFKNKLKFSMYGIWSTTGKTGLNWDENNKFGQGANNGYDEENGYYYMMGNSDDLEDWHGQYSNEGLPTVKTAGVHFNNKWDADKESLNLNYKILDLDILGNSGTRQQTILPDTSYYSNISESFHNHIQRNKATGIYEFSIDSSSSIKLNLDGSVDHKTTQSAIVSDYLAQDSSLINENHRTVSTDGDEKALNTNLLYKKKFRKKGRTLSFNFQENLQDNESTGFLKSGTQFFTKDSATQNQNIDQYKTFLTHDLTLNSRLTYTEPLSTRSTLAVNYGVAGGNSHSQRKSFNADAAGKYDDLDSLYSNNYRFSQFTQRTGLLYSYSTTGGFKFNAGNNWGFTGFKQLNIDSGTTLNRHFVNWYPQALISYTINQSGHLSLRYTGTTEQPTIAQLQPLANNKDPNNITIGNSKLRPSFENSATLEFNDFKMLHERYFFFFITARKTADAISNNTFIDSLLRQVNQAVNVNGNYMINGNANYSRKIKWGKFDFNLNGGADFNLSRNLNIVNSELNKTNSKSYGFNLGIGKYVENKFSIDLNGYAVYNTSLSTIANAINTHYWTLSFRPRADLFLPLHFQMETEADIQLRQRTSTFDKQVNTVFWNAWVGKKFFKAQNLLVKVSGNDLLNQNIGFRRDVSTNFITQRTYSTIQRYFMLSVIWNFTQSFGASKTQ